MGDGRERDCQLAFEAANDLAPPNLGTLPTDDAHETSEGAADSCLSSISCRGELHANLVRGGKIRAVAKRGPKKLKLRCVCHHFPCMYVIAARKGIFLEDPS